MFKASLGCIARTVSKKTKRKKEKKLIWKKMVSFRLVYCTKKKRKKYSKCGYIILCDYLNIWNTSQLQNVFLKRFIQYSKIK
jgi:hypothetical protein